MRRKLLTQQRVLVALAAVLLLSSLWPLRALAAVGAAMDTVVNRMLLPPFTHPLRYVAATLRRPDSPEREANDALVEERDRWWRRARELEDRLAQAQKTIEQLSGVPAELAGPQSEFLPASVSGGVIAGANAPTLTINKGESAGVRPGQIVLSGINFVGVVAAVAPGTATVSLITAPSTTIRVRFASPAAGGPPRATEANITANRSGSFTADIGVPDPVQEGDLAHVYNETRFARAAGLVVGKVTRIEKSPREPLLRRLVTVTPVTAEYLERVIVLIPREAKP